MHIARRPRHATIVAYLALFASLGGTAFAATQLPRNSVGAVQIQRGAVGTSEVANRSLRAVDFVAGDLPQGPAGPKGGMGATGPAGSVGAAGSMGPIGMTGAPGAAGPAGAAKAWAYIEDAGASLVVEARSSGITDAMVTKGGTGIYCFELSSIPNAHVGVASPNPGYGGLPANNDRIALVQNLTDNDFAAGCAATSDMVVVIHDISAAAPVNWFFNVAVY